MNSNVSENIRIRSFYGLKRFEVILKVIYYFEKNVNKIKNTL